MGAPENTQLSIALNLTPEIAGTLQREAGALETAKGYVIDGPEMAEFVNGELRNIKSSLTKIKGLRQGFVAPAKQIIANAEALFDPAIQALTAAESHVKGLLMNYQAEQERIAAEARRRQQEEERKARAEAEAKAAAERARAEQEAAEKRRQAEAAEAERKRQEEEAERLRKEGDQRAAAEAARKAAAAAAESARKNEEAQGAIDKGEAKATAAQLSAVPTAAPTPAPQPAALAGFSSRENWLAEPLPGKDIEDVKALVVAAIASGRAELMGLLKFDESAANKMAKALKKAFNVPGMQSVNRPVAASRAARG